MLGDYLMKLRTRGQKDTVPLKLDATFTLHVLPRNGLYCGHELDPCLDSELLFTINVKPMCYYVRLGLTPRMVRDLNGTSTAEKDFDLAIRNFHSHLEGAIKTAANGLKNDLQQIIDDHCRNR